MAQLDEAARRANSRRNSVHTALLIVGIGLLVAVPTYLIWGGTGLIIAIALVAFAGFGSQRVPPELVMRMYSARPIPPGNVSPLGRIVNELSRRAQLPKTPPMYIVPSLTLNAFATGARDNAAIAVTEGLLRRLETHEVAGVLAHEISHIANNDTCVMGLADVVSRMTMAMSYAAAFLFFINMWSFLIHGEAAVSWWAIVILYLAPTLSSLMQLALSRAREYDADLEAAMLTGHPSWLASALKKLEQSNGRFWEDLMYPVPTRRTPQPSILRSHPTTADRIRRLAALDNRELNAPINVPEGPSVSLIGVGPATLQPRYRFPGLWY